MALYFRAEYCPGAESEWLHGSSLDTCWRPGWHSYPGVPESCRDHLTLSPYVEVHTCLDEYPALHVIGTRGAEPAALSPFLPPSGDHFAQLPRIQVVWQTLLWIINSWTKSLSPLLSYHSLTCVLVPQNLMWSFKKLSLQFSMYWHGLQKYQLVTDIILDFQKHGMYWSTICNNTLRMVVSQNVHCQESHLKQTWNSIIGISKWDPGILSSILTHCIPPCTP